MNGTVNILLVEDDEIDAELIERSFRKSRISNPIYRATDGRHALEMLRGEIGETLARPCLMLLDLNMPRMNGIEFLEELRQDEQWRDSIVFVLTTSSTDKDKAAAYRFNVAGYIVKSRAGEDFLQLASLLEGYWKLIEFPPSMFEQ